jgi:hypothetical protein
MLKKGKEEIIYLLNKCIEKFQLETGKDIVQNTNRKNYEGLAITLSEISNQLPFTSEKFGHQSYEADNNNGNTSYPFRKYDITGGQIKDSLLGLVASPRPFLVDTCYIYVYGMGRQAFELSLPDDFLVQKVLSDSPAKDSLSLLQENQQLKMKLSDWEFKSSQHHNPLLLRIKQWKIVSGISLVVLMVIGYYFYLEYQQNDGEWKELKKDFNLLPYTVTDAERSKLEGIWLCYTGSPQARISDSSRYHKVVANLIEIKYKNGYFVYNRYGASFNHIGYIQFESPEIVSIYSRIKNDKGDVESPRHSLMSLESHEGYLTAISASWNFDVGNRNRIIGIREVYKKLGQGGRIEEVINSVENASCQCKIIKWIKEDKTVATYYLKNMLLDAMKDAELLKLINEKSILLKDPDEFLLKEKH